MKIGYIYYCLLLLTTTFSCIKIPGKFVVDYYKKNEKAIVKIEQLYVQANAKKPLIIDFADKDFSYVTLQIKTDSLRYVYEFNLAERTIDDTLLKFGYDTTTTMQLIHKMQAIKCTWINTRDYYVDGIKQNLVFMAIRLQRFSIPFSNKKYYILTFYKQPQYYNVDGLLLDKRNRKRLRQINGNDFYRINDKVCYTLSTSFR